MKSLFILFALLFLQASLSKGSIILFSTFYIFLLSISWFQIFTKINFKRLGALVVRLVFHLLGFSYVLMMDHLIPINVVGSFALVIMSTCLTTFRLLHTWWNIWHLLVLKNWFSLKIKIFFSLIKISILFNKLFASIYFLNSFKFIHHLYLRLALKNFRD